MATHSAEADQNEHDLPLTVSYRRESKKEVSCSLHSPFEILNKYGRQMKRLCSGEPQQQHFEMGKANGLISGAESSTSSSRVLSASNIMKMARSELSQSNLAKEGYFSPPANTSDIDHCHERFLKLASCLLDAAKKFFNKKYDEAERLLDLVLLASRAEGQPTERVITFFAQDLRERIDFAKGTIGLEREVVYVDLVKAQAELGAAIYECVQKLPFTQTTHFTAIQTILDSVGSAKIIHFIDIGKSIGSHWIVLMHDLANRKDFRVEHLKITVVCTRKDNINQTGYAELSSFAESINLPFTFKILHAEMYDLEKEKFELEAGEIVAVYMEFCLMCLFDSPMNTEGLMKGLKSIRPHLMVVSEIEVSINGSDFIGRFHEALIHCGARFDCFRDCLDQDNHFRKILEKVYFQEIIKNGVMAEDDYESFRKCRKIDFWREYFARFGIVETELSQSSMYRASLMIRESERWKSCTLGMNGKCMLLGWNGIPLRSLSAWKFIS